LGNRFGLSNRFDGDAGMQIKIVIDQRITQVLEKVSRAKLDAKLCAVYGNFTAGSNQIT
jgi:hypothetical protein